MPKRPSSFEDHLVPQFKVRIREKDIITDAKMKFVYQKTKIMLFNGAKSIGVNNDTRLTDSLPMTASNDYLRQTYLNSSCQIEVYADKLNPVFEECRVCHATKIVNCEYCGANLCYSCCENCESCQEVFCKNCVVSEYVGNREKFSCYLCGS